LGLKQDATAVLQSYDLPEALVNPFYWRKETITAHREDPAQTAMSKSAEALEHVKVVLKSLPGIVGEHFPVFDMDESFSRSAKNEGTNEGTKKTKSTYLHSLSCHPCA
jgi:hypothetical protein